MRRSDVIDGKENKLSKDRKAEDGAFGGVPLTWRNSSRQQLITEAI